MITCPECNGDRYLWNNPTGKPGYKCPKCNTKGYIYSLDGLDVLDVLDVLDKYNIIKEFTKLKNRKEEK